MSNSDTVFPDFIFVLPTNSRRKNESTVLDNSPQNTTFQQREPESTSPNEELLREVRQQIVLYQPEFVSTTQAPKIYATEDIQIEDTLLPILFPSEIQFTHICTRPVVYHD